jgi:anti-sigma B factor antagonist
MAAGVSEPSGGVAHGLEIEVDWRPGEVTFAVAGEWDLVARARFSALVDDALSWRPAHLVLDLSRLTFIDSSGVEAAVEMHQRAREHDAQLAIVPGPPAVQRPFEICRLTDALPFTSPR